MLSSAKILNVVDSHTEGEPTRIVTSGLPAWQGDTMIARRDWLRETQDETRRALVLEPRGHDAIVLAYLCPPIDPSAHTGVVFANDDGYLGMCGHGSMGVASALIAQGVVPCTGEQTSVILDTPVGVVECEVLTRDGKPFACRVRNVPSYAAQCGVELSVAGYGTVTVDVAYGGNWFAFASAEQLGVTLSKDGLRESMRAAFAVRDALESAGVQGRRADTGELERIDHVKLWRPLTPADGTPVEGMGSVDLTLCPGTAYDRSPCGTGTSAKLALLHASGKLSPNEVFVGQSVIGTRFRAWIDSAVVVGESTPAVVSVLEGSAWITGFCQFVLDPEDPLRFGIA